MRLLLGEVDYLNCLPIYYALEANLVSVDTPIEIVKNVPTNLNKMLLEGKLDVTPLSSIEYARHPEMGMILPNISISADGCVGSILLFSRRPVTELDGCKVAVSASSATSMVLLRVLFEHYLHVDAAFLVRPPDLDAMLGESEACLLIGDDALIGHQRVRSEGMDLHVADLGKLWKEFTGEKMIYAVWVVRNEFAHEHPNETDALVKCLVAAKEEGMRHLPELIRIAGERTQLPVPVLEKYFGMIRYGFDQEYRRALLLFYDYAYKSGLVDERRQSLSVWREDVV